MNDLNGWTARALDDVAHDVRDLKSDMSYVKKALAKMELDKIQALEDRNNELAIQLHEVRSRPRNLLVLLGAPIIVGTVTVVLSHVPF